MCIIENKIQLSKCGDLTGFIRLYMNWAAFHLAAERALHGILQMEEFYGTEEGGQGVYQQKKKKKASLLGQDIFFQGHGKQQGLYH